MWDPHSGFIAVIDTVRTRMVSNIMITKKISLKVSCEKAKLGFPVSSRAHARVAKAGSCVVRKYYSPWTSSKWPPWGLLYSFLRCCITEGIGFTILGKAVVCFVLSWDVGSGWTGHCFGIPSSGIHVWTITQRKRKIYWRSYPHSRACLLSPHQHCCAARKRIINVPPLVGTNWRSSCCLNPLWVLWIPLSLGIRYLHSHSEADDTHKKCFSSLVLRQRTWFVGVFFPSTVLKSMHTCYMYAFLC